MDGTDTDTDATARAWQSEPLRSFDSDLRAASRRLRRLRGSTIFLAGQRPTQLFYVAAGSAVMSRQDRDGRVLVLQRASSAFLAEASLRSSRYHCDATALTDVQLVAFPTDALRHAIDHHGETRWAWIAMLAAEIRRQRSCAERLALKTVRERLLHWIVTQADDGSMRLPGTRKELAGELGVSHEALYRTLAQLKRDGVLADEEPRLRLL
jgi:CRP/FNR family transcriptional regulator, dissimilatory nitrate respiration regulator